MRVLLVLGMLALGGCGSGAREAADDLADKHVSEMAVTNQWAQYEMITTQKKENGVWVYRVDATTTDELGTEVHEFWRIEVAQECDFFKSNCSSTLSAKQTDAPEALKP